MSRPLDQDLRAAHVAVAIGVDRNWKVMLVEDDAGSAPNGIQAMRGVRFM